MLESFQARKRKKLLLKSREGDLEYVSKCIKRRPQDINATNSVGLSSLHLSSRGGHTPLVSFLLHRGADVNAATMNGNTALGFACFEGHFGVVEELVKYGANVNSRINQDSFTPLYLACQKGHTRVVDYLLKNGADPDLPSKGGYKPCDIAIQERQVGALTCLLEEQGTRDKTAAPPLHVAIKNCDQGAIQMLLEEGVDVNERSKSGFTPLHYATYINNLDLVKLLVSKGAVVNAQSKTGISPLHVASNRGANDILIFLLNQNADKNLSTSEGLTALHCASKSGRAKELETLLERGGDVQAKTFQGMTPLHLAVQEDQQECVRFLLDSKACINDSNEDGFTPLHMAAYFNRVHVAKILLEKKCNMNARTKNGLSALDVAKKLKHDEMANLLMDHGAKFYRGCNIKMLPTYEKSAALRPKNFSESQILSDVIASPAAITPSYISSAKGRSETDVSNTNFPPSDAFIKLSGSTVDDISKYGASTHLPSLQKFEYDGTTSDLLSAATTGSIASSIGPGSAISINVPLIKIQAGIISNQCGRDALTQDQEKNELSQEHVQGESQ